jgi:hypothetical protein
LSNQVSLMLINYLLRSKYAPFQHLRVHFPQLLSG